MIEIPLTKGYYAIIDNEDYDLVSQYSWYASVRKCTVYAEAKTSRKNPPRKTIKMHRLIMGISEKQVDHINGNGLDNCRENLRFASNQQNQFNRKSTKGSSKYKGVYWHKSTRKWVSKIECEKKETYLGSFTSEEEAAKAYDNEAKELFGEFARLNFQESV